MMRRVLIACVLLVSTIRVSVGENDPTQVHIHTTTQHTQSNHPTITTSHKSQSNQKTTSTTQAQKEQEMMNVHEHTEQKTTPTTQVKEDLKEVQEHTESNPTQVQEEEDVLRVVDADGEEKVYSTKTASDRLRILAEALEHYTVPYDTEYFYEHRMFERSKPVNVTVLQHKYRDILWADYVVSLERPTVMRNSMVSQWPAFTKWNAQYFTRSFENREVKVHYSSDKIIRMHSRVQPLGQIPDVTWKRTWLEGFMRVGRLFGETYVPSSGWFKRMAGYLPFFRDESQDEAELQRKHALMFLNLMETAPKNLRADVTDVSFLTQPWRKVLEVNMWSGTDNVTTPLHYDVTHNFYVQVKGRKRFILFAPKDYNNIYLYPRIHPSTRMSQVASSFPNVDLEKFPKFENAQPYEVVLEAGDVLFIPAYWFHMPTALESDAADVPMLYVVLSVYFVNLCITHSLIIVARTQVQTRKTEKRGRSARRIRE